MSKSKNQCSRFYGHGIQGKHELIEPTFQDTHNAGEMAITITPTEPTFYARIVSKHTRDASSTAFAVPDVEVKATTLAASGMQYYAGVGYSEVYVTIEIFGDPNGMMVVWSLAPQYVRNTGTIPEYMQYIATPHDGTTQFAVRVKNTLTYFIDDTADKFMWAIGG